MKHALFALAFALTLAGCGAQSPSPSAPVPAPASANAPGLKKYNPIVTHLSGPQFRAGVDAKFNGSDSIAPRLDSYILASLPTEQDGRIYYCSNCAATTPCKGGGVGALAVGRNGHWACGASTPDTYVNVLNYGVVGDGAHDDGPALRAASAAVPPGGTLYFPPGKTYYINSVETSTGVCGHFGFSIDKSSITVIAWGATFRGGPNVVAQGSVYFTPNKLWCFIDNPIGKTDYMGTSYPFGAVGDGANSITLTTHADAGQFAAGDWVWLAQNMYGGGCAGSPAACAGMEVLSANALSGIVRFKTALPKSFPASPGPRIYNITPYMTHHFHWYGGTFQAVMPMISYVQDFDFHYTRFLNEPTQIPNGAMFDGLFDRIYYQINGSSDPGSAGSFDVELDSSRVTFRDSTAEATPGSAMQTVNIGEGSDHITLDHDLVLSSQTSVWSSVTVNGPAPYFTMKDSTVYSTGNGSQGAAVHISGCSPSTPAGPYKNCPYSIVHNNIITTGNIGLEGAGWFSSAFFKDNTVHSMDINGSHNGVACYFAISHANIIGNDCEGDSGLIYDYPTAYGTANANDDSIISTNRIVANGMAGNNVGLTIRDPGPMPPNPDITVTDNVITGGGGGVYSYFGGTDHHTKIIVKKNTGMPDRRPNPEHTSLKGRAGRLGVVAVGRTA